MPAPFTQGCARRRVSERNRRKAALSAEMSLGRFRARGFIDTLKGAANTAPLHLSKKVFDFVFRLRGKFCEAFFIRKVVAKAATFYFSRAISGPPLSFSHFLWIR